MSSSLGLVLCLFKISAGAHLFRLISPWYGIEEGTVILVKKDNCINLHNVSSINLPYVLSWFPFIAVSLIILPIKILTALSVTR